MTPPDATPGGIGPQMIDALRQFAEDLESDPDSISKKYRVTRLICECWRGNEDVVVPCPVHNPLGI